MKFQANGVITVHILKDLRAETWKTAQSEVEALESWNLESILDYVEIVGHDVQFEEIKKVTTGSRPAKEEKNDNS